MKRMKQLGYYVLAAFLLTACQSYKKVPYLQDAEVVLYSTQDEQLYDAKIMPKDLLTIVVSCTSPELAAPFNLTVATQNNAVLNYTTTQPVLQQYLVDNEGNINFPVLGELHVGGLTKKATEQMIVEKIEAVGMLESIPLWIVTLLGSLLITVLSFIMILTVYGRMFKLYMYTAIAPIPISTFAGEPSQSVGKNFIKSYAGVCLEGAIIALACIIFSVYAASPPAVGDTSLSAVTIVWNYIGELVFNLLVLVGAVKASDRIVKEMMGL